MKRNIPYIVILSFLSLFACTKERENSERFFVQINTYSKSSKTPLRFCFDEVKGLHQAAWSQKCSDSSTSQGLIEIPLNTASKSSTFLFTKNNLTDTLVLSYSNGHVSDNRYLADINKVKIERHTFDSLVVPCFDSIYICPNENRYKIQLFY